jgi:hypothetical protein
VNKRRKHPNRLPKVLVDEHIHPGVVAAFRLKLETSEASRLWRFRGRDERDYVKELYEENVVFATSDRIFVNEIAGAKAKHAGIVYIPNNSKDHDLEIFAVVAAIFIKGGCSTSPYAFRNCILYPTTQGVHLIKGKKPSDLVLSWLSLFQDRE